MTANLCQNQTNNFNLAQKHCVFNKNWMRVYKHSLFEDTRLLDMRERLL